MNLSKKKIIIDNFKIKFVELIKEALYELPINLENIKVIIKEHYFFIDFTEFMNIYEEYKWTKIKDDYNIIKKKVNKDKKLYLKIIKIYGIINSYYTSEDFNYYNKVLSNLYNYNIKIKIDWDEIKKLHNILIMKRKNFIKKLEMIKIFIYNDEINNLVSQLIIIFNKIKMLKKNSIIFNND